MSGDERRGGTRATGPAELTEEALEAWGRRMGARAAAAGVFVALYGPLGSGKTRLVQAACRGAGVSEPVVSPTFTLVHRYAGPRGPVYHVDLFRIEAEEELAELGWEDLLEAEGPVFVEWAERAGAALPDDRWDVVLGMGSGSETRRASATARGNAPPPPPLPARGRPPAAARSGAATRHREGA